MPDKIVTVHPAPGIDSGILTGSPGGQSDVTVVNIKKIKKKKFKRRLDWKKQSQVMSIRSLNMLVSEKELVKDQPPNVDTVPDGDVDGGSPLCTSILVAAVVHIVLGVVSFSANLALVLAGTTVQTYLEASGSSSEAPSYIIFVSEGLTIVCGIALILGLYREWEIFFQFYPHILWINVVLDIVAITYSVGGWRPLNTSLYERLFESKALGFCPEKDTLDYRLIFSDFKPNFWRNLEKDMKCCGINGGSDWIAVCDRIPDSCCIPKKLKECRAKLKVWNAKSPKNITEVEHLLHSRNCTSVLNLERAGLKRDYIIYPAVILFFDMILMFSGNHLTQKFLRKIRTEEGKKELKAFRRNCCNACCRGEAKIKPSTSDDNDFGENVDNLNMEITPVPIVSQHQPSAVDITESEYQSMFVVTSPNSNSNALPDMSPEPASKEENDK